MGIGYSAYGSVSSHTALLTALRGVVLGTVYNEAMGGSGVSWSGTVSNIPVALGKFRVEYTLGGVPYSSEADGNGNFNDENISAGSINYTTGVYSITFISIPQGTPNADYTVGVEGRDWEEVIYQNAQDDNFSDVDGSNLSEMVLRNSGDDGNGNVIIGIREYKYPAGNAFGWDLNGYLSYSDSMEWNASGPNHASTAYNSTWERWEDHPHLPLIDGTMYYWIYSNRNRIVVVVKVQSNYESCYLGNIRRFGTHNEYPNPLLIMGAAAGNIIYSSTATEHQFILSSGGAEKTKCFSVSPGNVFIPSFDGAGSDWEYGNVFMPWYSFEDGDGTMTPTKSGRHLLAPVYSVWRVGNICLGDLDGVYMCVSNDVQSEDLIQDDEVLGLEYRVFQNIHRTDYWQFMAVAESEIALVTTTTTTSTSTSSTSTTSTSSTTSTTV